MTGDNMLSFKDWTLVKESFNVSLGIATPQSLGVISPSFEELLEAKKKSMKKKMFGDEEEVPEDDGEELGDEVDADESGDGEVVKPKSLKDDPDAEDMGGDEDEDKDEDMDDEEEDGANPLLMKMKKMKGKMKKKMSCEKKKDDKPMKKKMAEEVQEIESNDWLNSVSNMIKQTDGKNWDGISTNEDALLPRINPLTGEVMTDADVDAEPGPGEIGYAPQTRFGIGS